MDTLPLLGTSILPCLIPTFKAYHPLHLANKSSILSIPQETHRYGSHPRQVLDIYKPKEVGIDTEYRHRAPMQIMIFLYGGGLERGDRVMPSPPAGEGGLVYPNVGWYFASKGITTIIPDYVRTPEGAKYPSGAEDLAAVIEWVRSNIEGHTQASLYIMGHSAGGVHAITNLLSPQISAAVKSRGPGWLTLEGLILVSTPCHFRVHDPSREKVLKSYYGEDLDRDSPLGLLERTQSAPKVRVLMVNGTLDPEDEILGPAKEFAETWKMRFGGGKEGGGFDVVELDGHNHFSSVLGLGTGVDREEGLGASVLTWMKGN